MGVSLAAGHFLDAVSARYPEVVLGAQAASVLQIESVGGHVEVYLGHTWFNVVGILKPVLLDSTLDSTAFISLPVAERLFHVDAQPLGDLPARQRQPRRRRSPTWWRRPPIRRTPRASTSAARPTRSRPAPPPRASSPRCCWAWARWRCSSARSGSPTSWSSRCSSAAARSACAARWAPPGATSASSSSPSRRCWRRWAASSASASGPAPPRSTRWPSTSRSSCRCTRWWRRPSRG